MHDRESRWLSLGALHGSDADSFSLTYHFSHADCRFAVSGDEWTKVELALRDASATGEGRRDTESPGGGGGSPSASVGAEGDAARQRRSWALDPGARRSWRACDVDEPTRFSEKRTRRYHAGNMGVEGNVNPHEDTRGVVEVSVAGERFDVPMSGRHGGSVGDSERGSAGELEAGDAGEARDAGGIRPRDELGVAPILDELEISRSRDGFLLSLPLGDGARAYGLGEKTGGLDKAGRSWVFWNTDEPWHTGNKDPLYQSIPVVYLVGANGVSTVFVDSTATVWFDIGEGDARRLQIEVFDTAAALFLRHDAALPEAVTAYTGLTGRTPLPPEWALGFQQCRYSYFPESRVLEVADRMREVGVPCDVIYLDIHYMDGYRVFTWDPARFPEPKEMITRLHEAGFRLVTIVDPGVKHDPEYSVFTDGLAGDMYLEDPGRGPYVGSVWPGDAVFPDFTQTQVQEWWAGHHAPLFDAGVDGIWNDMNDPADFTGPDEYRPEFTVPDRLVAKNDGDEGSMARLHNAYANGMNRATRRALKRYRGEERGFVLTRGGYAGVQRDAAVWTGDNHSWWEHIALAQPMVMNLGLSGVAFAGGDVGGFQQNASGELYARWIAAASLMPFFRAHSALDTVDHEPWSFGEKVLAVAKRYVELRYRLLPYLYTLFDEASRTGAPVMRPLVWEFPDDPRVARRADSYMVGSALLVAPIAQEGVRERAVYLPAGIWYDLWSGERYDTRGGTGRPDAGGQTRRDADETGRPDAGVKRRRDAGGRVIAVEAPLDRMPIFVRGGSIVPFETVRQHTGETGDRVLRLLVAPDGRGRAAGHVYGDAGDGFGYQRGESWRATVAWHDESLSVEADGSMEWTRWSRTETTVIGPGSGFPGGNQVPGA